MKTKAVVLVLLLLWASLAGCSLQMRNGFVRVDSVPEGIAHAEFSSPQFDASCSIDPWLAIEKALEKAIELATSLPILGR